MQCGVFEEHYETPYLILDIGTHPPGMDLQRTAWVQLLTTSAPVADVSAPACSKWGMAPSTACECGTEEQTVDYAVLQCPILRPHH